MLCPNSILISDPIQCIRPLSVHSDWIFNAVFSFFPFFFFCFFPPSFFPSFFLFFPSFFFLVGRGDKGRARWRPQIDDTTSLSLAI